MKKLFAFILVLCLLSAMLPMTVMAAYEGPRVRIYPGGKQNFYIDITEAPAYLISKEDKTFEKWTGAEAPTDDFVEVKLVPGTPNVVKVTFKNFVVDNVAAGGYTCHTLWFQPGEYNIEMELLGKSSMVHGKSASIKTENTGDVLITGAGSIDLAMTGDSSAPLWVAGNGDLLIKNATMNFNVDPGNNSTHHAICSSQGNVTFESSKINFSVTGGAAVWLGINNTKSSRTTMDTNTDRLITVKDCEMTLNMGTGAAFVSAAPAKLINSTMKVTKTSSSGRRIFEPAPTFEGEYTVIAGLAKNADKLDKLKVYQASKIGSYTYIYAVPGIVDLLPTEPTTAPTEPPVVTQPATEPTEETTPGGVTQPTETKPAATPSQAAPVETTPDTTEPADTQENGGNPIAAVMITILVMVGLAAAAVVVLIILKKKGIIK